MKISNFWSLNVDRFVPLTTRPITYNGNIKLLELKYRSHCSVNDHISHIMKISRFWSLHVDHIVTLTIKYFTYNENIKLLELEYRSHYSFNNHTYHI